MRDRLTTPDRVVLLLSLVPYLQEHGPTTVTELSEAFDVEPELLRVLVRFLGTAGVPGETLQYQHEDLFDIDWDALELHDTVSLVRVVAVDDTPRFSSVETAALLAGLHALTAMLPGPDADVARSAAEKLGGAVTGEPAASAAPVSVSAEPQDARLPALVEALSSGRQVAFAYRDAAGSETRRRVDPLRLTQGAGVWYLRGYCHEREAERFFRVDRMTDLEVLAEPATSRTPREEPRGVGPAVHDPAHRATVSVLIRERALPRLREAAPEILGDVGEGWLRARVDLGHVAAAAALVQSAPGDVVVEGPEAAREAVRVWAEQALAAYDA